MTPRRDGLTVVKIGGSCAGALDLRRWVKAIAACAGRVVIVQGGGLFADAVRAAQPTMGFDDAAAHHMALLAMEQFGRALVAFDKKLARADSVAALRRGLRDNKVPVWSPVRMTLGADVPASWDVTSDSLAVWLAGKLGAQRVVLMKQVELSRDPATAKDLAARGIVDPAFPRFLARSRVAASIIGPADHMAVAAALCDDPRIGTPIVLR